jgi:hypothetical protein
VACLLDDLRARVRALRTRGEGYLAITQRGGLYPALFVGFRGEHAVVDLQSDDETVFLLHGDGSVPDEEEVDVLNIEEAATFTGHVVMTLDHALELVEEFVHTGSVGNHPRTRMT